MKPRIEPPPHRCLKRVICGTQAWPLLDGDMAIHEAGHIVVGLALGMPCHDARISPAGASGRAGVLSPVGDNSITTPPLPPEEVTRIYLQAACLIWPGMEAADAMLNCAVMLVAGRQAELIAAGHRLAGELRMHDPDHVQARAVLSHTGQRLAMSWAQRQARHLLTTEWPEVEAIANTLRKTGAWTNSSAWVRESRAPSTTLEL